MGKIINGRDLMLFKVDADGNANAKAFDCAKSCQINLNTEFEELAHKDASETPDAEPTKMTMTASSSNFVGSMAAYETLVDLMLTKEPIYIAWSHVGNATASAVGDATGRAWAPTKQAQAATLGTGYYSKAYIERVDLTAQVGQKAEYTVSFKGVGEIKKRKPTA